MWKKSFVEMWKSLHLASLQLAEIGTYHHIQLETVVVIEDST